MHSVTYRRKSFEFLRFTSFLLIFAMFSNGLALAARKPIDPAAEKAKIASHGVGQGVRVTMVDKTEVKGVIASIGEQSFVLSTKSAVEPRTIEYAQITGVHRDKLSTGQKVTIGVVVVGAAAGITAAVIAASFSNSFKKAFTP